jgi:hypothetical protein
MKYVKWAPLLFILMTLLGIEACLGEARAEGVQTTRHACWPTAHPQS